MDSNFESAYRIMTSTQAREAFDLTKEPQKVRERYGMNRFGQSCLLARRLVERGVRFVSLFTGNQTWDHHSSILTGLPATCLYVDQGAAALVTDLKQRLAQWSDRDE